jgi:O-antigen/teichoic acid export membrane protein
MLRFYPLNYKAINFIKNFSYTLSSNFITLIISTLVILIVPKLIGVEDYGYWQVYLFYSAYVGFLHLGWNDGIYLRYGGKGYFDLDRKLFFSQFYMLVFLQVIFLICIYLISVLFIENTNITFIYQMIAIGMLIVNVRFMLIFILQATNRIKEFAKINILDRIIYCFLIVFILLVGYRDFKLLIVADIIAKSISLAYAMFFCKDIVFQKISTFYWSFKETQHNIMVGIKLMFANIASMLNIGVVRFGIERSWDVVTFGKVSLTLSIANLMMLFINALGIILFPILRRTDPEKLSDIYVTMRDFLMVVLFGVLLIYYPLKVLLSSWLPEFADSLIYMAILFPLCVFEGKMALLINTYMKTLRKEKLLLKINLISLFVCLIVTFITTIVLQNLDFAVLAIVFILAFRCILGELLLSNILGISISRDIVLEILMTLLFILSAWFINSWFAVLLYTIAYLMYLIVKRKDFKNTIGNVQVLLKA